MDSFKLSDFSKICRTCLNVETEFIGINSIELELKQIFQDCFSTQAENERLPQQICKNCLEALNNMYKFKQSSIKSLEILLVILSKGELKNEDNDTQFDEDNANDNIKTEYNSENAESETETEETKDANQQKSLAETLISKYKIYDLKCNICDKELSTKSTLLRHMDTHNTNRAFKFNCDICCKRFSDKGNLNKHIKRHKGKAYYKCEICDRAFYEVSGLSRHSKLKHFAKPIPCIHCSQIFYHQLHFQVHQSIHERKEFICKICNKIFHQKYVFNLHQKSHSEIRPFKCNICSNSFKHKFTLKKHVQLRHLEGNRREMCNVCGKLVQPGGMYQHLGTHKSETHKCPDCDRVYTNKYSMHTHRTKVHKSNPKRHFCEFCSKPHPYLSSLRAHINLVHSGQKERTYKCYFCDKSYTRQALVNAHVRRAHNNTKAIQCPSCEKAFYTNSEWKKHNRSHTGEKPFGCTVCGKYFGYSHVLKTHMKIHS